MKRLGHGRAPEPNKLLIRRHPEGSLGVYVVFADAHNNLSNNNHVCIYLDIGKLAGTPGSSLCANAASETWLVNSEGKGHDFWEIDAPLLAKALLRIIEEGEKRE